MEGSPRHDAPVGLLDAQVATDIAHAARHGRGADRSPTLDQLLAAFGEEEPTDEARRRVRSALELAGVSVRPDLMHAQPGERVLLDAGTAGGRGSGRRMLLVLVALAVVVAIAAAAVTLAGGGSDDPAPEEGAVPATATSESLAPPAAGTEPPAATDPVAPQPDGANGPASAPDDSAAGSETSSTTETETTPRRRRPAAPRAVVVSVDPLGQETFLCVDDGAGRVLFSGTLSNGRVFRGRHIRLNVGLGSTRVRVNGKAVGLDGSPAGLDIVRGRVRPLPAGQRPCA